MIAMTQVYLSPFENDVILEGRVKDFLDKIKNFNYTKIENKLNKMKQEVIKAGVDIKKIEQIVKSEVPKAVKGLKAKDTNAISTALKNIFTEMKENNLVQQVASSIMVLIVVSLISELFDGIFLGSILSNSLKIALSASFIAPLVEEIGKYFSIKMKSTGTYFIIFNVFEFTTYVTDWVSGGMSWPVAVGKRLMAVAMHATTTIFQKIQQEKGKPTKGLSIGILIHALWNGFFSLHMLLKHI